MRQMCLLSMLYTVFVYILPIEQTVLLKNY